MTFKFNSSGQIAIPIIIAIIAFASFAFVGGLSKHSPKPLPNADSGSPQPKIGGSQKNLQLESLQFISNTPIPQATKAPTPTGIPLCGHDNGVPVTRDSNGQITCNCSAILIECANKKCVKFVNVPDTCQQRSGEFWCQNYSGEGSGVFCIAKPVIYLYPPTPTFVDVKVTTPGQIVVSYPTYPEGGWKKVLAHPSGELYYQNNKYKELFYETNVNSFIKPSNGIIISSNNIQNELSKIIYQLGLDRTESQEFLNFWIPKLRNLNSPYIVFSIIEKGHKEAIDNISIIPEPDTRIEFIAYFKPIQNLQMISPLILTDRPKRIGFTEVEWGGVIDTENTSSLVF